MSDDRGNVLAAWRAMKDAIEAALVRDAEAPQREAAQVAVLAALVAALEDERKVHALELAHVGMSRGEADAARIEDLIADLNEAHERGTVEEREAGTQREADLLRELTAVRRENVRLSEQHYVENVNAVKVARKERDAALALVAAAYSDAALVLGEDKQDEWPASAILDKMPMDARACLDAMLAKARDEGAAEIREQMVTRDEVGEIVGEQIARARAEGTAEERARAERLEKALRCQRCGLPVAQWKTDHDMHCKARSPASYVLTELAAAIVRAEKAEEERDALRAATTVMAEPESSSRPSVG